MSKYDLNKENIGNKKKRQSQLPDSVPQSVIDLLKNDPIKRQLIAHLLSEKKEEINNFKKQLKDGSTPLSKVQRKYQCESPTALLRRKALENNSKTPSKRRSIATSNLSPNQSSSTKNVLSGVTAYVEINSNGQDRSSGAKALLRKYGAKVREVFTKDVTHVIFKDGSYSTYDRAKRLKIHVVSVLWLKAVKQNNVRASEKDYPALGLDNCDVNVSLIYSQIQEEYEELLKSQEENITPFSKSKSRPSLIAESTLRTGSLFSDLSSSDLDLTENIIENGKSEGSILTSIVEEKDISNNSSCHLDVGISTKNLSKRKSDLFSVELDDNCDISKHSTKISDDLLNTSSTDSKRKSFFTDFMNCNNKTSNNITENSEELILNGTSESDRNDSQNKLIMARDCTENINVKRRKTISKSKSNLFQIPERISSDGNGSGLKNISDNNDANIIEVSEATTSATNMSSIQLSTEKSTDMSALQVTNSTESNKNSSHYNSNLLSKEISVGSGNGIETLAKNVCNTAQVSNTSSPTRISIQSSEKNSDRSSLQINFTNDNKNYTPRKSNCKSDGSKGDSLQNLSFSPCPENVINSIMDTVSTSIRDNITRRRKINVLKESNPTIADANNCDALQPRRSRRLSNNFQTPKEISSKTPNDISNKTPLSKINENDVPTSQILKKSRKSAIHKRRTTCDSTSILKNNNEPLNDINQVIKNKIRRTDIGQELCVSKYFDKTISKKSNSEKTAASSENKVGKILNCLSEESGSDSPTKSQKLRKLYDPTDSANDISVNVNAEREERRIQIKKRRSVANPSVILPITLPKTKEKDSEKKDDSLDELLQQLLVDRLNDLKTKKSQKHTKTIEVKRCSSADEQKELADIFVNKKDVITPKKGIPKLTSKSEGKLGPRKSQRLKLVESIGSDTDDHDKIKLSKRRSTLEFQSFSKGNIKKIRKLDLNKQSGIVCTKMHRDEVRQFEKTVEILGNFVVEDVVTKRTTHLVAGEAKRTINMLRAISRGCWILKKEWLTKSLEAGKWLPEEDFELNEFSPAVQRCRLQRQAFGNTYSMDIFKDFLYFYVHPSTNPKCSEIKELILLCCGKITNISRTAKIVVGKYVKQEGTICVNESWILDCITFNKIVPFKKYRVSDQKRKSLVV